MPKNKLRRRLKRKEYICNTCNTHFATGMILKKHRKSAVCGKKCQFCEFKSHNKKEIDKHLCELKIEYNDRLKQAVNPQNREMLQEYERIVVGVLYGNNKWTHVPKEQIRELNLKWQPTEVLMWGEYAKVWVSMDSNNYYVMPRNKTDLINKMQYERFFRLPMSCRQTADGDMTNYVQMST